MIEIFAPCMRVEPSDLELERRVGAWSQCVTAQQGGRNGRNTLCHQPPSPLSIPNYPRRRQQRRSRTSRWCQSALLWAILSKWRRCTVRSPLPPTTVSSALALLLVTTFVLTRKTLPPPVRSAGHGNPPMRRLSLGPAPSYRSSSNNTNTVPLPPTPPITPPSVIPFVSPQQPHPLH